MLKNLNNQQRKNIGGNTLEAINNCGQIRTDNESSELESIQIFVKNESSNKCPKYDTSNVSDSKWLSSSQWMQRLGMPTLYTCEGASVPRQESHCEW